MIAAARIVFAVLAVLALAGCGPLGRGSSAALLAGTQDVELTYELDREDGDARAPAGEVRTAVMRRLGAARVGADVVTSGDRVRVVVDEALGPRVDELLTWTGTLMAYALDADLVLAPPEASSRLTAREDGDDRWYEGARADVLRAIEAWPVDPDHRVVAEPLTWAGADTRWRTRVVDTRGARELADGALVGWGDGATIRIRAKEGSPAAAVLAALRARPGATVLTRGAVSLGVPELAPDGALRLPFGDGPEAYARAQREKELLATPRLPSLRRVDAVGLAPNHALALGCIVVPILLSLAWLAFVRRFDRAHPEPVWLVGATFVLGALGTIPAVLLEAGFAAASPWLDARLVALGGRTFALPLAIVVLTVVVGLSEEGSKRLAAQLAVRRREFDEPIDGIIYAVVASLGFAAAENVVYFAAGRMSAPVIIGRAFMTVPAHMFFGALWGSALGARLVAPRARTWPWLLAAALCHGLFDAFLLADGTASLALGVELALATAFVLLVRRALRHGVVTREMLAIRPEERSLFRMGRPVLFWLSVVALHALALGIFVLGAYLQLARHRPSLGFFAGSAVMLGLLAVAALGVAQTMPLDVAVDAYGVTFAGAARPWRQIRGLEVERERVVLECEGGPILLGPGRRDVVETLGGELRRRLDARDEGRPRTIESRR